MSSRLSPDAGISISDRAVRFISFRGGRLGSLEVKSYGEVPLPEGAISMGEVKDRSTLSAALRKLQEEHGFKYIAAALPEEKAYIYTAKIDRVPEKDLHDVVAFTLEENVPFPLSDSVFSYKTFEEGEEYRAAVSVVSKEVIEAYGSIFVEAGLLPVAFDLEPEAIAKSLIPESDQRPQFIIYLGERKASLIAAEGGVIKFSSTHTFDPVGDTNASAAMAGEIKKFFLFWKGNFEHVIVAGPKAANETVVSKIMEGVEAPYSLGNVWQNVAPLEEHLPQMSYRESLSYAAAIGAALPRSEDENGKLLPESLRSTGRHRTSNSGVKGMFVYLGILLALSLLFLGFL